MNSLWIRTKITFISAFENKGQKNLKFSPEKINVKKTVIFARKNKNPKL